MSENDDATNRELRLTCETEQGTLERGTTKLQIHL